MRRALLPTAKTRSPYGQPLPQLLLSPSSTAAHHPLPYLLGLSARLCAYAARDKFAPTSRSASPSPERLSRGGGGRRRRSEEEEEAMMAVSPTGSPLVCADCEPRRIEFGAIERWTEQPSSLPPCFFLRFSFGQRRMLSLMPASKTGRPLEKIGAPNFRKVDDFDSYESLIYGTKGVGSERLLVGFFCAQGSTQSKSMEPLFLQLPAAYPEAIFFLVDINNCPRAAYHAGVELVPTIALMQGDDAYRASVSPTDHCDSSTLIARAKTEIEKALAATKAVPLRSTRSWYTHNVDIDNLNIYKTGWTAPDSQPVPGKPTTAPLEEEQKTL